MTNFFYPYVRKFRSNKGEEKLFYASQLKRVQVLLVLSFFGCGQSSTEPGDQQPKNPSFHLPTTPHTPGLPPNEPVKFQEVPLVDISFDNAPGRCTGTLIADDLVLTAGHCFDDHKGKAVKANSMSIRLKNGNFFNVNQGDIAASGAIFVGETFFKDVGYVKTKKNIPSGNPLPIGTNAQALSIGTTLHFFGFSSQTWHDLTLENWRPAHYLGVNPAEWNRWTLRATLSGTTHAQAGDSGGPMLFWQGGKWLLVGVLQGDAFRDPASRKRLSFTSIDQALTEINGVAGSGLKTEVIP